jgi:release factor glutamine methyltransferase
MTVGAALAFGSERLRSSDSARFDAHVLLAALLRRNTAWLFAHADEPLEEALHVHFLQALERRATGEPVAYILGEAGFYGRRFAVTPDVLVPRPESELLVTCALAELRTLPVQAPRLCDVGTGSGILATTLAAEIPGARVTAVDVSAAALAIAAANARAQRVEARIAFVLGDIFAGLPEGARFDGIVANLPYVRANDFAPAPDPTSFEPRLALDGGPDGLVLYRRLLASAPKVLAPRGWLLMEAGPDTVPALAALARRSFRRSASVWIERDYARLERVVAVRL